MRVTIFGLGHIGLVTGLFLADKGHEVYGIEISSDKIRKLNEKKLYIYEKGLSEIFLKKFNNGFYADQELRTLSSVSFVCVGTPSLIDGSIDLSQILKTTEIIAKELKTTSTPMHIIYRSTFPPGTMEEIIIPMLVKISGKKINEDFFVYHFPEFLREGSALEDISKPSMNIWSSSSNGFIPLFYDELGFSRTSLTVVDFKTSEMIKYLNNTFHALKISFANEMASLASRLDVDINELFKIFKSDTQLNISEKYLMPGFAFGGPCLPKEVKGVNVLARSKSVAMPLTDSILSSNEEHLKKLIKYIEKIKINRIGIAGITFKPGTNDLRNSPLLDVIKYFSNRPSYLEQIFFYVYDQNIIEDEFNALNLKNVSIVKNVDELAEQVDFFVLGTFKLVTKDTEKIRKSDATIVDLHYFVTDEEIKKNPKYISVFEVES